MTPTSIEHIITYSTHQLDLQTKILELLHKIKKRAAPRRVEEQRAIRDSVNSYIWTPWPDLDLVTVPMGEMNCTSCKGFIAAHIRSVLFFLTVNKIKGLRSAGTTTCCPHAVMKSNPASFYLTCTLCPFPCLRGPSVFGGGVLLRDGLWFCDERRDGGQGGVEGVQICKQFSSTCTS